MSFANDPRPLYLEGDFLVEIPGMSDLKFEKSSEVKGTITKISRTMGGEVYPRKYVGNVEYADVTLEYAATNDTRIREWFELCRDAIAQRGALPTDYFKNVSRTQLAANKSTRLERVVLHNAWPCELDMGANDAENKNIIVRKLVLCYWYPEFIRLS